MASRLLAFFSFLLVLSTRCVRISIRYVGEGEISSEDIIGPVVHNTAAGNNKHTTTRTHVDTHMDMDVHSRLSPTDWEQRSPIHRLDLIKEPYDASIPTPASIQDTSSPYTYAMMCWLVDPDRGNYRPYLNNMMVARKILLESGSKADFNVVFKISYESEHTRLPAQEEGYLKQLGIKFSYLPKTPDGKNFFTHQLNKFELWNLTQYERVLYLDGDVLPLNSLDYLFDMSTQGIIKPNLMLATYSEPANGGFFLLQPSAQAYQELRQIMYTLGPQIGRGKFFQDRKGLFGHTITEPDQWETSKPDYKGTAFTFHGGHTDQGLLYSYLKYNTRNVTQVFGRKVVHFGPDPQDPNNHTIVEKTIKIKKAKHSPFANYTRRRYKNFVPISCARQSYVFFGAPGCTPPYSDHTHYTGEKKPWKFQKPQDLWADPLPKSDFYLWWRTLETLREKDGIVVRFKLGTKIQESTL